MCRSSKLCNMRNFRNLFCDVHVFQSSIVRQQEIFVVYNEPAFVNKKTTGNGRRIIIVITSRTVTMRNKVIIIYCKTISAESNLRR